MLYNVNPLIWQWMLDSFITDEEKFQVTEMDVKNVKDRVREKLKKSTRKQELSENCY